MPTVPALCVKLADHELFGALPGAGPVFSARLLAAFGEIRERFTDAGALQPRDEARTWQSWGAGKWKIDPSEHPRSAWDHLRAAAEERYRRALAEDAHDVLAACRALMGENAAHILRDEAREPGR